MTKLPEDIETFYGLWVLFELPKLSKEEQKKELEAIKKGDYPKNKKI
jgi:hypothetical protein